MNACISRKVLFPLAFLLSALFCATIVSALGVSPSEYSVIYRPNSSLSLTFTGITSKDSDTAVKIFSSGPLDITLPVRNAVLPANGEKEFEAVININKAFDPGTYSSLIYIEEVVTPEQFLKGTSVSAHEAVAMRVNLKVPYPGRYLEAEFDEIKSLKVGEVAYFTAQIHNYGGIDLSGIRGVVEIYGSNGTKVAVLETSVIDSLAPLESKQLRAYWITPGDLVPGPYEARIAIDYGGDKPANARKLFQIGDIFIDILGVSATNTYPGSVAKFSTVIKSEWLESIPGVYSEVIVYDSLKNVLGNSKSSSVVLESLSTSTLVAFWEVPSDLPEDRGYAAKIAVHYAGKVAERTISFELGKEAHIEQEKTPVLMYSIVIVLLVVLIGAVSVLLWLQFRRKR